MHCWHCDTCKKLAFHIGTTAHKIHTKPTLSPGVSPPTSQCPPPQSWVLVSERLNLLVVPVVISPHTADGPDMCVRWDGPRIRWRTHMQGFLRRLWRWALMSMWWVINQVGPRQDGPVEASTCVEKSYLQAKKWLQLFTVNICGAFEQLFVVFTCKMNCRGWAVWQRCLKKRRNTVWMFAAENKFFRFCFLRHINVLDILTDVRRCVFASSCTGMCVSNHQHVWKLDSTEQPSVKLDAVQHKSMAPSSSASSHVSLCC